MRLSTTGHWLTGFHVHGFSKFIDSCILLTMTPCCPMENRGTAKIQKSEANIDSNSQQIVKEQFIPGRDLSVDEAMVKFKGRSSIKQYMPKKPIKRGFKIWMLADSDSGYVTNFQGV